MIHMPLKRAWVLGLTPVSDTTALTCFSSHKKLLWLVTMTLKTLYQTQFQKFAILGGLRSADCWLSRATGSLNALILMLRMLPLLGGSWGKYIIPYLQKSLWPFFLVAENLLSRVTGISDGQNGLNLILYITVFHINCNTNKVNFKEFSNKLCCWGTADDEDEVKK